MKQVGGGAGFGRIVLGEKEGWGWIKEGEVELIYNEFKTPMKSWKENNYLSLIGLRISIFSVWW